MYLFFYCCLGLQCVHFTVMLRSSSCKFHNVMLNYGVAGENDPLYKLIASRELLSSEEVLKPWPVVHFLPIKCNLEELTHLCSLSLTFCCCFCCCFIYVSPPPPWTHPLCFSREWSWFICFDCSVIVEQCDDWKLLKADLLHSIYTYEKNNPYVIQTTLLKKMIIRCYFLWDSDMHALKCCLFALQGTQKAAFCLKCTLWPLLFIFSIPGLRWAYLMDR